MTEAPGGGRRPGGDGRRGGRSPDPARLTAGQSAPRPHFTGRAAILAIVLCAIALSLAYPVREYIAERRQIDQLQVARQQLADQVRRLRSEQRQLSQPAYIEQQARDRLHMCLPTQMCYEIIGPKGKGPAAARRVVMPWYSRLWSSVQQADGTAHARQRPGAAPKR